MVDKTNDNAETIRTYVKLTAEGAKRLDDVLDSIGTFQVTALSRLVEWFCRQDRDVQVALLDRDGDAAAVLIRKRLGDQAVSADLDAMPVPQVLALIRRALERIERVEQDLRGELKAALEREKRKKG